MRNIEGDGLNNGCVADSWSEVRHLSVLSAIVDFGGNPSKWLGTWRTESDSAVEKNVD